jgi:hypothetical protein
MSHRKTIVPFVCVFAGSFFLFSVARTMFVRVGRGPEPRAELAPAQIDLGSVQVGQPIRRTFMLRNSGDARLLVVEIKPSCQCTILGLATRALSPGVSVPLEVEFKANDAGAKRQHVLVKTNDPVNPILALTLRANVVAATQPVGTKAIAVGANH